LNVVQLLCKNISFRTASEIGRKLINFAFIIFLARVLGAEGFGKYSYLLAYTNLFAVIVDAGLNSLYAREASRKPDEKQKIISALVTIKLTLAGIMSILLVGSTLVLSALGVLEISPQDAGCLTFFALFWVLNSTIDLVNSVYVQAEKLEYDAAINLGHRLISVALGVILVLAMRNVLAVSEAYLAGAAISLLASWLLVRKRFGLRLRPSLATKRLRFLLAEAFPLILTLFFASVYFKVDQVMLKVFRGDAEVGWYSAAFRVLEFVMLVPAATSVVVLPIFSRLFVGDKQLLSSNASRLLRLLFVLGIGVCILLWPSSGYLVLVFGEKFGPQTRLAFQILIWTAPLIFVNYILTNLLVATRNQKKNALSAVLCTMLNVSLNIALIPHYGFVGAAGATIATEALLLWLSAHFLKRPLPQLDVFGSLSRVAAAGLLAGAAIAVSGRLDAWARTVAATFVFCAGLWALGGIKKADSQIVQLLLGRHTKPQQARD